MKTVFRSALLLVFFLMSLQAHYASAQIEGIVVDAQTKEPLAFAHIVINDSQDGTLTDIDGIFRLTRTTGIEYLTVSYLGYDTRKVKVENTKIRILLQRSTEVLNEIVVYEGENPAIPIINKAIERKKSNNPENLPYFQLQSYNKFSVVANPKADDESKDADFLRESNLFLMESVTEKKYRKPGQYSEKVIANRVSGLKNPTFTTLANGLQPFSFYDDYIELLGVQYTNPLGKPGLRQYNFYLEDSVISENGKVYIILFETKRQADDQLTGFLHINTKNWALENVIAQSENYQGGNDDDTNITFKIQQKYFLVGEQWFPKQLNTNFKIESSPGETVEGIGRTYLDQIDLESVVERKDIGRVSLSFDQAANKRDSTYWGQFRTTALTPRELRTYEFIDSIGQANNFDRILKGIGALTTNQLKIGKVSLDINRLLAFNRYEGLRLGAGLHTNQDFSRLLQVGGYFGYGFRDKDWKYGGDLVVNLSKQNDLQFFSAYSKDVNESGNIIFHKEEKGFSSVRDRKILVNNMDIVTRAEAGLRFYWLKYLDTQVSFSNAEIQTTSGYTFADNNESLSAFDVTEASLKIRYAPKVQYVESFFTKIPVYKHHPIIWFNLTRGLDAINGDFEYTRMSLKLSKNSRFKKLGSISFTAMGFSVMGDTPYPTLFNGLGTYYDAFGLETQNGFQTMRFNEFLSDQFAGIFTDIYIAQATIHQKYSKPSFHIKHNMGWGQLDQPERHQNFEFRTMEDGFFESGLSIKNILVSNFTGLGIGVYYRYGANALENSSDNLVFKFNTSILLN